MYSLIFFTRSHIKNIFKNSTNYNRKYHSRSGVYGYNVNNKKISKSYTENVVNDSVLRNQNKYCNILQLINAYRNYGHKIALIDPLNLKHVYNVEELNYNNYGISDQDMQITVPTAGLIYCNKSKMTIREIVEHLNRIYGNNRISVEYTHLYTLEEREWFAERFESFSNELISNEAKIRFAKLMLKSETFDQYLGAKFSTVKRYSGEGGESAICFYDEIFNLAANSSIKDIVLCMAHRGRLNLLTCLLKLPPVLLFRKMRGLSEYPPNIQADGDVLSHLSVSTTLEYYGKSIRCTMLPNSSHLEAVNPVAIGKARAKERKNEAGDYSKLCESRPGDSVICLQIHGDAAFVGQGIIQETINLSQVPHFRIGGSVHLILNNQVGFTTDSDRAHSSIYSSCILKSIGSPVIHVNSDCPEAIVQACRLAFEYREKFRKDVIVDFVCYRKYGHNELDEPALTQPSMYQVIRNRQSTPTIYSNEICNKEICSKEELQKFKLDWQEELAQNFSQIESYIPKANHLEKNWSGLIQAKYNIEVWDTGFDTSALKYIGSKSIEVPIFFKVHSTIEKHILKRLDKLKNGTDIDWATAEALALGSLQYQGFNARLCGQDVGRGTFSHRHMMIVNQDNDEIYVPLNNLNSDNAGKLEIVNSILSEEAVLAFEYGISIDDPNCLVIWEAQFGDFFNGAQIIIDAFISSGETKWLLQSPITLLLPHGIDGAGPEHSSCRIERFLQLTNSSETKIDGANINIQFANPTTPAQYFHLLRRQLIRNYRKPLIIPSPKILLRSPVAVSSLNDMKFGETFKTVIGDTSLNNKDIKKVIFVSGKHFYALETERAKRDIKDTAIIRIEELCPFPAENIQLELKKYPNATDYIWSQEEHRNSGAWSFVNTRFENIIGKKLRYVGRQVSSVPAVGIGKIHKEQVIKLFDDTFSK